VASARPPTSAASPLFQFRRQLVQSFDRVASANGGDLHRIGLRESQSVDPLAKPEREVGLRAMPWSSLASWAGVRAVEAIRGKISRAADRGDPEVPRLDRRLTNGDLRFNSKRWRSAATNLPPIIADHVRPLHHQTARLASPRGGPAAPALRGFDVIQREAKK
jgi:hypothetical protein